MNSDIKKAIKVLKDGGIVIFPTDTAFGIGCRIDNEESVQRLFKIRKRPVTQAIPVLVDTVKMAQRYLSPIPKEVVDKLIEPYWPGALTIILYCNRVKVPSLVRGDGETLGVRIPNHKAARAIIRGVGVPILGPSANFHGEKTPYHFSQLDPELVKLVDYVVPGECLVGEASTIIDCSKNPWKILRQGGVKLVIMNTLVIDTSSNQIIRVGLKKDSMIDIIEQKIDARKAQVVLPMIDKLLKKHQLKSTDLTALEVHTGPGSFTGLRVGISIANALAYSLKIPVNGKRVGMFVEPVY